MWCSTLSKRGFLHCSIFYSSWIDSLSSFRSCHLSYLFPPYPTYIDAPQHAPFQLLLADRLKVKPSVIVQACYISIGAIFGALLRMIIAQLFGEACRNPGTVGWLSAAAPLCVTADGTTTQQGGIVFADLPSNLLGSFLMGLFQDSIVLGLAVPMAVAWLSPFHPFQNANVLHTAFKTGFCGSLTTFSSWNSEMVVMIFSTGDRSRHTQLWSALFGYIIGMETSLGSFACGCSLARRLHRSVNPVLAAEKEANREKIAQGVHLNKDLPDFERRFLPGLKMEGVEGSAELYPLHHIDALVRWRDSTVEARRVGNPLLPALIEVENALLVLHRRIPPEAESIARAEGWEVDSLIEYASSKDADLGHLPSVSSATSLGGGANVNDGDEPRYLDLRLVATVLSALMLLLLLGLVLIQEESATAATNRTMIYGMLFAPTGALLRWHLSRWNGKCDFLSQDWRWLPVGTLFANVFGSALSITMVALEYRIDTGLNLMDIMITDFWGVGTIRAIKVGFAGCLTTVSTFVAEVSGFMHNHTDHGYPYILVTLVSSCVSSCLLYGIIVYLL